MALAMQTMVGVTPSRTIGVVPDRRLRVDRRIRPARFSCSMIVLCGLLAACGGGGQPAGSINIPGAGAGLPTPTPVPTPTPTPTPPPPFSPVIGSIFENPSLTSSFRVVARGWQSSANANGTGFVAEGPSEDVAISYTASTASYQASFPFLAANTMYRTSDIRYDDVIGGMRYEGAVAPSPSAAVNHFEIAVIRPGTAAAPYDYVAWLPWYTSADIGGSRFRYSSGVAGVAQFTLSAQVPQTGTRRYIGRLLGNLAESGDFVVGRVELDIDFAAGTAAGTLFMKHVCFMGCEYPEVAYRLADIVYSTGGPRFDGKLSYGGLPPDGAISGGYAGPNAEELMLSFRASYYNPDAAKTQLLSGIGLARRQ
ncbi:hypothetical protein M9978_13880 [Sphingomonas sp. MG17]|uniref:Uncharacterized protein n=1 Tax=Sphingomonas tagetis TaxID=2949092 RepID=A0A9X2KLG2_9SPHN|nr:hypothetical protein [Sphingomonas tagetis]MCP3731514.1 hypothetical protein [Sphingomonas tagetis]